MNDPQRKTTERTRLRLGRHGKPACAVALAFFVCFPPSAFAYLDPSTGSMVVSAIVGIFASIALAVKTYWYKIKGFFKRGGNANDKREPSE